MTPQSFFTFDVARRIPLVEKLVHDIDEQLEHTIDAGERARVMAIVRQCLTAMLADPSLPWAAEARFYCVTPRGKAIGRALPAWQFAAPVPELLASVLRQMKDLPSSEIHAYLGTPVDVCDGLTPAKCWRAGRLNRVRRFSPGRLPPPRGTASPATWPPGPVH